QGRSRHGCAPSALSPARKQKRPHNKRERHQVRPARDETHRLGLNRMNGEKKRSHQGSLCPKPEPPCHVLKQERGIEGMKNRVKQSPPERPQPEQGILKHVERC